MSDSGPFRVRERGFQGLLDRGSASVNRLLEILMDARLERGRSWLPWGWMIGLYIAGILWWGIFLNWGRLPFTFHDWAVITVPRIAFVQDAILKGQLPLHIQDTLSLKDVTDRFMAIPDVILSPQMIFLAWMDIGHFVLIDILLFYSLGVAGLIWLRKKTQVSLFSFTVLFLLFNFNGHITAHISIGHLTWAGYFLFPWIAGLVLSLVEKPQGWRWVGQMAFLLFLLVLQGSFHHFVWWVIFLGLLGIAYWERFSLVLKTVILASLLSMVRMLPALLDYAKLDTAYLSGYPTVLDVFRGLMTIVTPVEAQAARTNINPLRWWEYDLYVGLLGMVFIGYFGLVSWLRNPGYVRSSNRLYLPLAGLFVLSIGRIYYLVTFLPVPLLTGERVSSRMIIVPFTVLILLAVIYFQKWLSSKYPGIGFRLLGFALLILLASDLWQHSRSWRVIVAASALPPQPIELSRAIVANHPDPAYIALFIAGCVISLSTGIFLVYKYRKPQPAFNR